MVTFKLSFILLYIKGLAKALQNFTDINANITLFII